MKSDSSFPQLSLKEKKLLNILEQKQFDQIDRLELSEKEIKWLFENHRLMIGMEESNQALSVLNQFQKDNDPAPVFTLQLYYDQVKQSLSASIREIEEQIARQIKNLDELIFPEPTTLTRGAADHQFRQEGESVDTCFFLIEKETDHYKLIFKQKITQLEIKQLDGPFEFKERKSNHSYLSITPGSYRFQLDGVHFKLDLPY